MSSSPAAAAQILRDLAKPDAGLVARFEAYTEPLQQRAAGMMSAKARKKRGRDDAQRFGSFLIKVAHQALQVARLPREALEASANVARAALLLLQGMREHISCDCMALERMQCLLVSKYVDLKRARDALACIAALRERVWELHADECARTKCAPPSKNFPPPFSIRAADDLVLCRIVSGCLYHYIRCCTAYQEDGEREMMDDVCAAADEIGPWLERLGDTGDPQLAVQYRDRLFKVLSKRAASLESSKSPKLPTWSLAVKLRGTALDFLCQTTASESDTNYIVEQALSCAVQFEKMSVPEASVQEKAQVIRRFYLGVVDALDLRRASEEKENVVHKQRAGAADSLPMPIIWNSGKFHQKSMVWLDHFASVCQKAQDYDNAITVLMRGLRFLTKATEKRVIPTKADICKSGVQSYSCSFHVQLALLFSERHIHSGSDTSWPAEATENLVRSVVLTRALVDAGKSLQGSSTDQLELYTKMCKIVWRNVSRVKKLAGHWCQRAAQVPQGSWTAVFDTFVALADVCAICSSLTPRSKFTADMQTSCLCAAASARCRTLQHPTGTQQVKAISDVLDRALGAISARDEQMYLIAQKFYQLAVHLYEERSFELTVHALGRACETARSWASAKCKAGEVSECWEKCQLSHWYKVLAACLREEDRLPESVAAAGAAVAFYPELESELPHEMVQTWMKLWLQCVSKSDTLHVEAPNKIRALSFENSRREECDCMSLVSIVDAVSDLRQPTGLSKDALGRVFSAEAAAYRYHISNQLGKATSCTASASKDNAPVSIVRTCVTCNDKLVEYALASLGNASTSVEARAQILIDAARADMLASTFQMTRATDAEHTAIRIADTPDDELCSVHQLANRAIARAEQAVHLVENDTCKSILLEANARLAVSWICWHLALSQERTLGGSDICSGKCQLDQSGVSAGKAMEELHCALQLFEGALQPEAICLHQEKAVRKMMNAKEMSNEHLRQALPRLQSVADLCGFLQDVECEIRTRQVVVSAANVLAVEVTDTITVLGLPPAFGVASALVHLGRTFQRLGFDEIARGMVKQVSDYVDADEEYQDEHSRLLLNQWHTLRGVVSREFVGPSGAEKCTLKARTQLTELSGASCRFMQQVTLSWNHCVMSSVYLSRGQVYDAVREAQLCVATCLGTAGEHMEDDSKLVLVPALGRAVPTSFLAAMSSIACTGSDFYQLACVLVQGLEALGSLWEQLGVPKRAGWCFRQGHLLGESLGSRSLKRRFARHSCLLATRSHHWEEVGALLDEAQPSLPTNFGIQQSTDFCAAALQACDVQEICRAQEDVRLLLLQGYVYRKQASEQESAWTCFEMAKERLEKYGTISMQRTAKGKSKARKNRGNSPQAVDVPSSRALILKASYLQARTRHAQGRWKDANALYQSVLEQCKAAMNPALRAASLCHLAHANMEENGAYSETMQGCWMLPHQAHNSSQKMPNVECVAFSRDCLLEALSLSTPLANPKLTRRVLHALARISGRHSPTECAFLSTAAIGTRFHSEMRLAAMHATCSEPAKLDTNAVLSRTVQQLASFVNVAEGADWITEHSAILPADWTVVNMSLTEQGEILVTRLRSDAAPIVLRFPVQFQELLDLFNGVIARNKESMSGYTSMQAASWSKKQKAGWWKRRQKLDDELGNVLAEMQTAWFKHWSCVLSAAVEGGLSQAIETLCQDIREDIRELHGVDVDVGLLRLCVSASNLLSAEDLQQLLGDLLGKEPSTLHSLQQSMQEKVDKCIREAGTESAGQQAADVVEPAEDEMKDRLRAISKMKVAELRKCLADRNLPTTGLKKVLVERLQSAVQEETMDAATMQQTNTSALTRQSVILVLGEGLQHIPWEGFPVLQHVSVTRVPSLPLVFAHAQLRACDMDPKPAHCREHGSRAWNHSRDGVRLDQGRYLLNPGGDLLATEAALQPMFEKIVATEGWREVTGRGTQPSCSEFREALSQADFFVYCGHGTGEQYLHRQQVVRLEQCATTLLIGCSSGRADAVGEYEGEGMVHAYLVAGSPAVVANLWDVSDKDIDRFSLAVLDAWVLGSGDKPGSESLADVLPAARGACKLRHLVGCSPVCYGVPVRRAAAAAAEAPS